MTSHRETPAPDLRCTAINCSVGRPLGDPDLDRARRLGLDRIELWWPWATPEPSDAQVDELVDELRQRGLTLIGLNFWGGDTSAGERGVLHEAALSQRHLDAHARLAEKTGADKFNLLVGRGGRALTDAQRDRIDAVAASVTGRGLGTVLVEPSKGAVDYPVQTLADATALTGTVPGTALLADFWHLAGDGGTEGEERTDAWLDGLAVSGSTPGTLPAHVQIADDPGRGAPGTGVLPLRRWVTVLRTAGYTGDIVGEWVW